MIKITTLIDNLPSKNSNLTFEHGLSYFIQTQNLNILFDTGKSDNFLKNAKLLNIDLNSIDIMVLSHAHYDHCGGFVPYVNQFGNNFNLFLGSSFFSSGERYHCKDKEKYIGVNFNNDYIRTNNIPVNFVHEGLMTIADGIYIISKFEFPSLDEPTDENMKSKANGVIKVDDFSDEICLCIDSPKGLLVVCGCAHSGIINILETVKIRLGKQIYALIGGLHLCESSDNRINVTSEYLKKCNIPIISVSHCTGKRAVEIIKNSNPSFLQNETGYEITIF